MPRKVGGYKRLQARRSCGEVNSRLVVLKSPQVRELAELFVELAGLVEVHAEPAAELEQQVDKARLATEQARLELEKTAGREEGGCTVS